MSDKRVVLGIAYSQGMDLGEKIAGELEERGLGDVECVLAHTKSAVETLLGRDSSVVGVILLRDISVSSPYTAKEIVMLSESYPDVVFVPVCIESYKGSGFAQELLDGGVYNMVFNCDSELGTLAGRIAKPYSRRDARRYYGLMGESERKTEGISERSGLSDENYYSYLDFLQEGEGVFPDKLNYIKGILDNASFTALLLRLPEDLKDKVMQISEYENFYSKVETKPAVKTREKKVREPRVVPQRASDSQSKENKRRSVVASLFEGLSSTVSGILKNGGLADVKGIRKLVLRSQKEFEILESALVDELSVGESVQRGDSDKAVEHDPGARVVVSEPVKVCGPDTIGSESVGEGPVKLIEEIVCPDEQPVCDSVVSVEAQVKEPVISVGEIRVSGNLCGAEEILKPVEKRRSRKKEKKQKERVQKVKQVYIGSVVIAVASIKKGIGCSHVARVFANYMYWFEGRRTCFIGCEKALYSVPEGLLPGIDVLSFSELALAYNRYDCIVMDVGTDYRKFHQEIVRATVKVMCCTADDTVVEHVYKFMQQDAEPDAWVYAYNHVLSRAKIKRVEELMEDYKYLLIPACDEKKFAKAFIKDIKRILSGKCGR